MMEHCKVLNRSKPIIGMLHVPALPGSPQNALSFKEIVRWVLNDAETLLSEGIDALILENFGDAPFFAATVPAHTATFLTTLGCAVKTHFEGVPLGINVLRNDALTALAIAAAIPAEAQFIRVNVHTGARLTDQGIIEGRAAETLRYRKQLGADVQIFADVQVKHSSPLANRPFAEDIADTVSRGLADAIIITGSATGKETPIDDLRIAKSASGHAPVIAGSGVDATSVREILTIVDAVIVGTALKTDHITTNPVSRAATRDFINAVRST
jgi:membrane complex biogenesis BtpA family protein